MHIDIDQLRRDMKNDSYGAFFGGGFGDAVLDALSIESVSDEKLIEIAQRRGIDLKRYIIQDV